MKLNRATLRTYETCAIDAWLCPRCRELMALGAACWRPGEESTAYCPECASELEHVTIDSHSRRDRLRRAARAAGRALATELAARHGVKEPLGESVLQGVVDTLDQVLEESS